MADGATASCHLSPGFTDGKAEAGGDWRCLRIAHAAAQPGWTPGSDSLGLSFLVYSPGGTNEVCSRHTKRVCVFARFGEEKG